MRVRSLGLPLALGLALAACSRGGPLEGLKPNPKIVVGHTFSAVEGSLKVVAVMPFYPQPDLRFKLGSAEAAEDTAAILSNFFTESLVSQGVRVVAPSDLSVAFTALGRATPRKDQKMAGELASQEFGATAVVLGSVSRWRERGGAAIGSDRPASVGFEVSLFEAKGGRRLFTARFDHTQRTLSGSPMVARQYPGAGTRFLTVNELARWGSDKAAARLVEGQWRLSN